MTAVAVNPVGCALFGNGRYRRAATDPHRSTGWALLLDFRFIGNGRLRTNIGSHQQACGSRLDAAQLRAGFV